MQFHPRHTTWALVVLSTLSCFAAPAMAGAVVWGEVGIPPPGPPTATDQFSRGIFYSGVGAPAVAAQLEWVMPAFTFPGINASGRGRFEGGAFGAQSRLCPTGPNRVIVTVVADFYSTAKATSLQVYRGAVRDPAAAVGVSVFSSEGLVNSRAGIGAASVSAVPEPGTVGLVAGALLLMVSSRRNAATAKTGRR